MTASEFLRDMEEALEVAQNSLNGSDRLRDLACWDSMSALIFMALADEKLEVAVSGDQIANCQTVDELLGLLDGQLSGSS